MKKTKTKNKNNNKNKKLLSRNNTYFDTSPTTMPKFDEPWYCIKDAATPKVSQLQLSTLGSYKLRFDSSICTVG